MVSVSAVVPRRLSDALGQFLREYKILYLTAGAGWGKTTAVRGYLQSTPHVWLQVQSGRTPRFSAKMPLVVLDDFHNLSEHLEKRVAEIFRRSPRRQKLCLLSRGPLPDFLLSYRYDGSLRLLTAEELALGVDEISQLAAQRGMTLSMDDIFRLEQVSHGYPPLIEYLLDAFPAEGPGNGWISILTPPSIAPGTVRRRQFYCACPISGRSPPPWLAVCWMTRRRRIPCSGSPG